MAARLLSIVLLLAGLLASPGTASAAPSDAQLAARWARVHYQDTDSTDYDADNLSSVNFDSGWNAKNNRQIHLGCRSWGAAPVRLDQRAVDVDVGVAGHLRREQHRWQARSAGGEHGDALVHVGVPSRAADLVVDGRYSERLNNLAHASTVPGPRRARHGVSTYKAVS